MFVWFWEFLYSISQILFEVIDGVLAIANKVVGVEPIEVGGKNVSFINALLGNDKVRIAFVGGALVGIFLLMIFSTIAICRNMKDGKKSNSEIAAQVFKTLGLFLLVPSLMIGFSSLLNVIVQVMFDATRGGAQSMGRFLFDSFRPVGMNNVDVYVDWRDVNSVRFVLGNAGYELSDYRFFFSWLVCIPLLFFIARSLFLFVDRTLSIIILFVFAPISMSTSVLDDGARFKIWRDKVIAKFISGYGMIIAINIYIIVLSFVTRRDVVLFPGSDPISFLCNFLIKCAFAIGGAFFLPKVFGLVGDLFVNGGGSGEFREYDSAVNDIKTLIRDVKRDRANNKNKEEKGAGGGGGMRAGLGKGNPGITAAAGVAGGSNQNNKKLNDNFGVGSNVSNSIKNEPEQKKDSNEDKSKNDKNFKNVFGVSRDNYKNGTNSNNNKVAGGDVVKNTVSSAISSSPEDKKESK